MRHATPRKQNSRLIARPTQKYFWQNLFAKKLPRVHLLAAIGVAVTLTLTLTIFPTEEVAAKRQSVSIELPITQKQASIDSNSGALAAEPVNVEEDPVKWNTVVVKSGDSLSTLFQRAGLGATAVHNFITSNNETKQLKRIMPGETLGLVGESGWRVND